MAKYKIKNTNILHNGTLCKIGDVIELDKEKAEKLSDVLVLVKETKTETKTENKTTETKTTKNKKDEVKTEAKTDETPTDGGNDGK